ncbi:hypothetical protein DPEC_G00138000 [Dallia pectoralis]|uniref:Uncharacterized protein n=1 Tax=Dallia pectoralis TaxID=75939 RepID=A0ACC2GLI7_DALPE|nr:hypothetical protein DPEC_G00138000 [Dallia pectoralis]
MRGGTYANQSGDSGRTPTDPWIGYLFADTQKKWSLLTAAWLHLIQLRGRVFTSGRCVVRRDVSGPAKSLQCQSAYSAGWGRQQCPLNSRYCTCPGLLRTWGNCPAAGVPWTSDHNNLGIFCLCPLD